MFPSTYSHFSASAMTLPLKVAVTWGILNVCLCSYLGVLSLDIILHQYLKGKSTGHVGVFITYNSTPCCSVAAPCVSRTLTNLSSNLVYRRSLDEESMQGNQEAGGHFRVNCDA